MLDHGADLNAPMRAHARLQGLGVDARSLASP
jgi:hypothetical protein